MEFRMPCAASLVTPTTALLLCRNSYYILGLTVVTRINYCVKPVSACTFMFHSVAVQSETGGRRRDRARYSILLGGSEPLHEVDEADGVADRVSRVEVRLRSEAVAARHHLYR